MIAVRDRSGARRLRQVGALALAAVALVGLSACAAGQQAGTAEESSVIDGSDVTVGSMHVRGAAVAPPSQNNYAKGSDAPLQLVLVNGGTSEDSLTKVTTSQASSVEFFPHGAAGPAAGNTSGNTSGPTGATGANTSAPTGATGGNTSAPTGATGGNAAGGSTIDSIKIPPGQRISVGFGKDEPAIVLRGLTSQLFPAQSFQVTFTFANAGTVTVAIPVALTTPPSSPATAPINVGGPEA